MKLVGVIIEKGLNGVYISSCGIHEVDSTIFFPLGSQSNDAIIFTVGVYVLGGVDEKIHIRDESFNMPTQIDW